MMFLLAVLPPITDARNYIDYNDVLYRSYKYRNMRSRFIGAAIVEMLLPKANLS